MSWKAKIAGMTGRATMISVIADEVRRAPLPLLGLRREREGRGKEEHGVVLFVFFWCLGGGVV
jgi:hypothetical protein